MRRISDADLQTALHTFTYAIGARGDDAAAYHISGAYGGVSLRQRLIGGGEIDPLESSYVPKRELYGLLGATPWAPPSRAVRLAGIAATIAASISRRIGSMAGIAARARPGTNERHATNTATLRGPDAKKLSGPLDGWNAPAWPERGPRPMGETLMPYPITETLHFSTTRYATFGQCYDAAHAETAIMMATEQWADAAIAYQNHRVYAGRAELPNTEQWSAVITASRAARVACQS